MMTAAPTARSIIAALERHKFQSDVGLLAALDGEHRDAVRQALSAVKGSARIDVGLLIDSVCREVADRAAREAADGDAVRREVEGMIAAALRGELDCDDEDEELGEAAGALAPGSVHAEIARRLDEIAARLGDRAEREAKRVDPPKRRSIPRTPSRRTAERDSSGSPARPRPAAGREEERVRGPRRAAQAAPGFGPRLLGPGADYDPRYRPMRPPWLLDDEPDEEIDDGTSEARFDAY